MSRVAFAFTVLPASGVAFLLQADPLVFVALGATLIIGLQQGSEMDVMAFAICRTFCLLRCASIFRFVHIEGVIANTFGACSFEARFDLIQSCDLA